MVFLQIIYIINHQKLCAPEKSLAYNNNEGINPQYIGGLGLISRKDGVIRSLPILPTLKNINGAVSKILYKEWINMELNKDKPFFKSYKELFLPPYKLDATEVAVYGLLAERYQFFNNLPQGENLVKNSKGQLGILFSETNIAESLNTTRPKVSRTIAKLELFGLLEVERKAKKPSVYIVKNIPTEINNNAQEYVADRESKKKLTVEKWRQSKYGNQDNNMYQMIQGEHVSNDTSKDSEHVSNDTTTCIKSYNNMYQMIQQHVSNEYSNKNKKKELNKNQMEVDIINESLPGDKSPNEGENSLDLGKIKNNNDVSNDMPDTSSKVGLSLPSDQDNEVLIDMISPSEQDTMLLPGKEQAPIVKSSTPGEQSTPSLPTQHGVQIEQRAASSQKLPEGRITLREWLANNCKIQWIIDDVLAKLDGDQIMPEEEDYLNGWGDMMADIAAALPTLRDVLVKCGIHPDNITTLERFYHDKNKPLTASTVIGTLCGPSAKDKLMVYIFTEDYTK